MPRPCSICTHSDVTAINKALVAGEPLRDIAERFTVTASSLSRHKPHIPAALAQAQEAVAVAQADDLLGEVRRLQRETLGILDAAKRDGDNRTALTAIREARGNVELLGRLLGELQAQAVSVNAVIISPEWQALRSAILRAVEPYPEALTAIRAALEAGHAPG